MAFDFDFNKLIEAVAPSLITAGTSLAGNLYKPDYTQEQLDQNASQFAQTNALDQEKMAQALQIARINAGAGNAGAGAAVAAARIKAAVDEKAIRQQALQGLMQGKLDVAKMRDPKTVGEIGTAQANQNQETGKTGLAAFQALIQALQNPLLKGR